jgi:hypothetical protein
MNGVELYQIKGFDWERFVSLYLREINGYEECTYFACITAEEELEHGWICADEYENRKIEEEKRMRDSIIVHEGKRGVKDKDRILCKGMYVQDVILRLAYTKKDRTVFSLNADIMRSVIGAEYKVMLLVLQKMGYLQLGDGEGGKKAKKRGFYEHGGYSKLYSLGVDVEVEIVKSTNKRLSDYKTKTLRMIQQMREDVVYPAIDRRYGKSFRRNYMGSLNAVKLSDEAGLNRYIEWSILDKPGRKFYYSYVCEQLKSRIKYIQKIDNAGRIYHVLTNLERELKQFLNIGISADCKNSHPLLFCYFIYRWRGVGVDDARLISYELRAYDGYEMMGLRRYLANRGVPVAVTDLLYDDDLEYICLASKGRLWDEVSKLHLDVDRNKIKELMFKQVFYSNTKQVYSWKPYARDFKTRFPHVYSLVAYWKSKIVAPDVEAYMLENDLYVDKDRSTTALSVAMMNLEARIFVKILKRLYRCGWKVIHIHDCIIFPNVGNGILPKSEDLLAIMEDAYNEFGLFPTFDCKYYVAETEADNDKNT